MEPIQVEWSRVTYSVGGGNKQKVVLRDISVRPIANHVNMTHLYMILFTLHNRDMPDAGDC